MTEGIGNTISGDRASNMYRWQGAVRSEGHWVIDIPATLSVEGRGLRGGGGLRISPADPGKLIGIEREPSHSA